MSVVDEIKERLDIVDVISDYVPLKKAGRNYKALCPFHSDSNPSLVLYPKDNFWKCMACKEKGDDVKLVMALWGLSREQAVNWIRENI